jgi:ketosteroid isomerase-like protein
MTEDNVAIVRRFMEAGSEVDLVTLRDAWRRGEVPPLLAMLGEILDPDVVWDLGDLEFVDGQVYHGPEGVTSFWLTWMEEWDEYRYEARNWEAVGDSVLVDVEIRARSRTGIPVTMKQTQVWTLRDGKVVHFRINPDRSEARASLP